MKKKTTVLERPKKSIAQETRDVINRKILFRRWYKRRLKKTFQLLPLKLIRTYFAKILKFNR